MSERRSVKSVSGGCHENSSGGSMEDCGVDGIPFITIATMGALGFVLSMADMFVLSFVFSCVSILVHSALWVSSMPAGMMRWAKETVLPWFLLVLFFAVTSRFLSPLSAISATFWMDFGLCKTKATLFSSNWMRCRAIFWLLLACVAGPYFPILYVCLKAMEFQVRFQMWMFFAPFQLIRWAIVSNYKSAKCIDQTTYWCAKTLVSSANWCVRSLISGVNWCTEAIVSRANWCAKTLVGVINWSAEVIVSGTHWFAKSLVSGVMFWIEEMGSIWVVDDPELTLHTTTERWPETKSKSKAKKLPLLTDSVILPAPRKGPAATRPPKTKNQQSKRASAKSQQKKRRRPARRV